MDRRLIFRYRSWTIKSQAVRGRVGRARRLDMVRLSAQGLRLRTGDARGGKASRHRLGRIRLSPGLQEKPRWGSRERPYRKPTLVAGCESTKVDG